MPNCRNQAISLIDDDELYGDVTTATDTEPSSIDEIPGAAYHLAYVC
jgi:hypothetical protein